jgi:hypothetical protein
MMNRAFVLFALVVCGRQAVQAAGTAGPANPENLVRQVTAECDIADDAINGFQVPNDRECCL